MVRKRADAREPTGEITLEGGSWDRFSGHRRRGTPLTADGSGARASLLEAYSRTPSSTSRRPARACLDGTIAAADLV